MFTFVFIIHFWGKSTFSLTSATKFGFVIVGVRENLVKGTIKILLRPRQLLNSLPPQCLSLFQHNSGSLPMLYLFPFKARHFHQVGSYQLSAMAPVPSFKLPAPKIKELIEFTDSALIIYVVYWPLTSYERTPQYTTVVWLNTTCISYLILMRINTWQITGLQPAKRNIPARYWILSYERDGCTHKVQPSRNFISSYKLFAD